MQLAYQHVLPIILVVLLIQASQDRAELLLLVVEVLHHSLVILGLILADPTQDALVHLFQRFVKFDI